MDSLFSFPTLGIIGGGQLARMMLLKAKKMGFKVAVLDPTPSSPAGQMADIEIVGSLYDEEKIRELARCSDILTFDIEHFNVEALKEIELKGKEVHPSPSVLEIIQDKFVQKQFFARHNIPVPKFKEFNSFDVEAIKEFGIPCVQKARTGGYDGKGVFIIRSEEDFKNAFKENFYVEECVDIEKELAVMVARGKDGEVKVYPVVEMVFNEANMLDMLLTPASIEFSLEKEAKDIAIAVVESLDGVGVFGVELFLTKDGKILLNEVAPRPHNSGHYTIEACVTCQFEQHIRAVSGLPLGSTELLTPAVMINVLGAPGYEGRPLVKGLSEILKLDGVSFHFYGKKETRPFRKMGHVTIVDKDVNKAVEKAKFVKENLEVVSNG